MEETPVAGCSRRKHADKQRKKDPRSWENVAKAIASMSEVDKLRYISEKYKEIYEQNRKLHNENQQLTKQCVAVQKERDQHQSDLTKSMVTRARLESLCRELQKQNKLIKDENIAKLKEEEERRKEVSIRFASKLSDINAMMDDNKVKSETLREENLKMTTRLAELYAQFQKREEDIGKMSQQLDLERQYSQATLKKMELEMQAEKQIHAKEQALMKSNLEKSEANCAVLAETVKGLQDHIDVYKHQYEDFESTMTKSAKVFDNFKAEIANMTKQVNALEIEAQSWKNKFHDSMKALVEMSEVKKNQDAFLQGLDKKNDQLNKLCRQLQIDRSNYLKLLKNHGIEPPSATIQEKQTEEPPKKTVAPKMTKKEKELQILKNNLKTMQDELSNLKLDEAAKDQTEETQNQITENGSKDIDNAASNQIENQQQVAENGAKDTGVVEEIATPEIVPELEPEAVTACEEGQVAESNQ